MASNNADGGEKDVKKEPLPRGLLGKGGTPVPKSARLPSLRGPKDLTLGGKQKKAFKPNIPVRPKEKSSADKIEDKLEIKQKRQKKERNEQSGGGRGRGRGRFAPETVQSNSIFAQGPTAKTIRRDGSGGGSTGGNVSFSSRSSTSVKVEKQDKAETQQILDNLLRDDFIDDEDGIDIISQPVSLPLLDVSKRNIEGVKRREGDQVDSKTSIGNDFSSCSDVLTSDEESHKIILVQLPDCLPGLMSHNEQIPRTKIKSEPGTSAPVPEKSNDETLTSEMAQCKLSDLSEGRIGKLQILASGKTRLVLGDVVMDISRGAPCGFLQELVCMTTEGDSGEMAVLGQVTEKLIGVPNIDCLLNS